MRGRATPAARTCSTVLLAVGLSAGATACTGGGEPAAKPSASPSASATPTAAPAPSAPWKVVVTRVSGRLPQKARPALEAKVRRTVSGYLDDAFLGGTYPRSDFGDAFATFTPGAARRARGDLRLLTNATLGPTTQSVRAVRRTAYLSVLAPGTVVAGVSARVDVAMRVDRGERPARRVRLTGRLLLTRDDSGGWSVFGYDLARSDTAAGGAS